ncbi:hypothetical protein JQ633_12635 [Bradyrhizobium tropiciagri]|uniref:hypothetical protein n=1 Tax=Bradyrhizobium tropiciagri TaxID=312253 RepID=UPI001BAC719C|nr:hypothetical protein [Bradyrhizobium tropiciagri]MBR0871210.1 hypothetical protein [Bradyrhizobium tropiciagri]
MTDILGPANAPNAVTIRPSDTRSFGADDTWFKDCTSSELNDGTKLQAGEMNAIIGFARSLARGNGLTEAGAKIVPENNADDAMGLKAVQYLIQRGRTCFGLDTGLSNAMVVSLSPAPPEYKQGMHLFVIANNSNTKATTINLNGLGNRPVKLISGDDLSVDHIKAGMVALMVYVGTHVSGYFQLLAVPIKPAIAANQTYYVNAATGSDTANDGRTVGTPFASIQKALDVMSTFDNNGFSVTIIVANGTYSPVILPRITGSGICTIIGNILNSALCVVSGAGTSFAGNAGIGTYRIQGFKCVSSGGDGVFADGAGCNLFLSYMEYGACAGPAHIVSQRGGQIVIEGPGQGMAGAYTKISGSCPAHMIAINGTIDVRSQALTITTPVTFSSVFANSNRLGLIFSGEGVIYSSVTNPGNVTGMRYSVSVNAVIDTNGGGVNYFPGTIAGIFATGGEYV